MDSSRWVCSRHTRRAPLTILFLGIFVALSSGADTETVDNLALVESDHAMPSYVPTEPGPAQPIPFSHRRHVGELGLDCGTCHAGASLAANRTKGEPGVDHMTLPGIETCMNCHAAIATDKTPIESLKALHDANAGIEWVRVYRLLDGVNWSHQPHIDAGLSCQACHGDVTTLEVMRVATPVTAMATCLNCHRATSASSECETCHAWPSAEYFRRVSD
jgi:hypothetical protein